MTRNKVYRISIPTKTTKTTKSLVVVLRFCSKLSAEGKLNFALRNPRPLCALLAVVAMHTGRGRSCAGRKMRKCTKIKKEKPRKQGGKKPLPPLLAQIGGKGLFNPQKRNFLYEPHHTGITKVKQVQRYNNVKTNANKS